METLIAYVIKVNIALIFFFLIYIAFLKRDTFFTIRRYFFLAAIMFSFVYPLVTVSAWGNIISFDKPIEYTAQVMVEEPSFAVVAADDLPVVEPVVKRVEINWSQILLYTLLGGFLAFLTRFFWQLASILHIRSKSTKKKIYGIQVFDLKDEITPFSFFQWIFIHLHSHSDAELRQILLHEQTHARQWHSVDIIVSELLCIFFWWNPAVWFMKREMAINLEYLADNGVLREGVNCRDYQYHLLRLTYQRSCAPIVNNFNVSLLKQRITMMNKTKSPARKLAKYLIALPLALLLVAGNSVYAQEKKGEEVFIEVDKNPEFPGGNSAFKKFLANGVKYPVTALENNEQGRVVATFVVEKDGSISNVEVPLGVTPALDAEVVRLLRSMPRWTHGEQRNKPVRVQFLLPVVFRLQGENVGTSTAPKTENKSVQLKGIILDELVVVGYAASNQAKVPTTQQHKESNSDEVFIVVQEQPSFPGGNASMNEFIAGNLQYPKIAMENGIQGRVITQFLIEKDGSLSDIQIVRGVDPSLDKEALRLIASMPKWNPGKQRGQNVRVRYTLPVTFRLSEGRASADIEKSFADGQEKLKEILNKEDVDEIFVVVEQQPEFPGGNAAMMSFISDNIRYPKVAYENGIQGRVIANFIVNKDGSISDVRIMRSIDPALDAEAVRVLESMPAWKPGMQRGQPVNVRFTFPVVFSLEKKEPKVTVDKIQTIEGEMVVQAQAQPSFSFPGGNSAYMKFLSDNIRYPVEAQKNKVQGVVYSSFKVDNAGNVTDAKIESGENALLNNEVLRILNQIPQWTSDNEVLITGKITDADNNPLQGASVILKGTSMGTISDVNGNFSVKVPKKEGVLAISFVGYKTSEVALANLSTRQGGMEIKAPFVFRLQGNNFKSFTGPKLGNEVVITASAED